MEAKHTLTTGTRLLTQVSAIILLLASVFMQETSAQNAVGSINGALTVNDMGAAVYSMTFDAPNGGRMTPKIGLAYSSQSSGYGLAGYGIDVTGISVITSGGRDMFHNGKVRGANYDKDSNFYLDGKRLVLQEGEDGEDGADCEDGAVYAPEGDPYTKVTLHGDINSGTAYFEVTATDGTVFTYGSGNNSRLQVSKAGATRTAAWYISTAVNRYGESISYAYVNENLCVSPQAITYGTDRGLTAKVEFSYRAMAGANVRTYRIGSQQGIRNKLLASVTTNINGQVHRKYDFTYDETAGDRFSRLTTITESNGAGESLNPTVLTWNTINNTSVSVQDIDVVRRYMDESAENISYFSSDVNGDGISDIIRVGPSRINGKEALKFRCEISNMSTEKEVFFKQGESSFWFPPNVFNYILGNISAMDFDGDGLNDIALIYHVKENQPYVPCSRTSVFVMYGKQLSGNDEGYVPELKMNIQVADCTPLSTAIDFDGDGREEIFLLEKKSSGNGYYGKIIKYESVFQTNKESIDIDPVSCLDGICFSSSPKKVLIGDYNNDGLTDILVLCENSYSIIYNNGYSGSTGLAGVFTKVNSVSGECLKDFWRMEQGDFDGDGLVDFFYHDKDELYLGIAYNNGDGTFWIQRLSENWDIYELTDREDDNDKFAVRVMDFDRDGMSDVVISKYNVSETRIRWLRSTGNGFELFRSHVYYSKDEAKECYIFTGDFDGDGVVDLANTGYYLNDSKKYGSENIIHIYKIGEKDANFGRLTSLTDGFGNTTSVEYDYATTPAVYEKGMGSYPVNSYSLPIALVKNLTAPGMNKNYIYSDLQMHVAGRGMLGFEKTEQYDRIANIAISSVVNAWDMTYWIPKKTTLTTKLMEDNNSESPCTIVTTNYSVETKGRNYITYPYIISTKDFDGCTTSRSTRIDPNSGKPLYETIDIIGPDKKYYTNGKYIFDYEKIGDQWLPPHQYTITKHPDDRNYHYACIDYNYDNKGDITSTVEGGQGMYIGLEYNPDDYCKTEYSRDRWGNVTSETFHGNDESTGYKYYEYDRTGRFLVKTYTVPESTTTTYTYDVFGNVLTETDETNPSNPLTTIHTYDTWGRRIRTVNPDGTETIYYTDWDNDDNIGNWFSEERHTGAPWTRVTYDRHGREIATSTVGPNYINVEKNTEYNEKGQVSKITNIYGKRTTTETFTYDARGRVLTDMHSSGASTTYEYGRNTISVTDAAGRTTTKSYDPWGNVKSVTDNEGNIVEYQYGSHGNPVNVTTGDATVTMEYDELGRRTKIVDPDAGTVTTSYGKNGQVSSETDGRGVKTTYTYDALGRVTQRKREGVADKWGYKATNTTTYSYGTSGNAKGRVIEKSSNGNNIKYEYDNYGRVVKETRPNTFCHCGHKHDLCRSYKYNALGQLESVTYPTIHYNEGLTVDYRYDSYGYKKAASCDGKSLWSMSTISANKTGMNDITYSTTFGWRYTTYDNDGYPTRQYYKKDGIKDDIYYTWDKLTGNLTSRTINGVTENFTYDELDRLVEVDGINPLTITYANNGNIQSKSNIGDYTYNPADRPHAVCEVDNANGTISNDVVGTSFDPNGKLGHVISCNNTKFQSFTYGPDDDKWSSNVIDPDDPENNHWDIDVTYWGNYECVMKDFHYREYYFLDNDVIIIRDSNDDDGSEYSWLEHPATLSYYQAVTDHLGSIIAVYDKSQRKVFEASYDAWGKQTVTLDEIDLHHGYTGHEMLFRSGLIHMDGRVYDPAIGRFLSPDNFVQLPENSQSFNRYSYCINNPLKYTDPSGENFLVALAINVGVSMLCAAAEGQNVWRAAAFGALGTCASYGIGAAFGHVAGGIANELLRAGAHGVSGGVQSALQGGSFFSGFAGGALASMAGSGAQWAGWSDAGIVNATTVGGAIGSLAFGGDWYNGASLGFSIGALNHTGDDDNNRYDRNDERDVLKMMPWQQPYDYNMSYSNQVGFIDTGVDYAGKGWNALSIHTKSKLTWEAFKFSRDKLGYRFKTNNSTIYRKVVPQKLNYASKVLGRATIWVNAIENGVNIINTNRIGVGNVIDFGVAYISVAGGLYGLAGGLLYLGGDYLTYKNTGMDIREHLNLKYSISW